MATSPLPFSSSAVTAASAPLSSMRAFNVASIRVHSTYSVASTHARSASMCALSTSMFIWCLAYSALVCAASAFARASAAAWLACDLKERCEDAVWLTCDLKEWCEDAAWLGFDLQECCEDAEFADETPLSDMTSRLDTSLESGAFDIFALDGDIECIQSTVMLLTYGESFHSSALTTRMRMWLCSELNVPPNKAQVLMTNLLYGSHVKLQKEKIKASVNVT